MDYNRFYEKVETMKNNGCVDVQLSKLPTASEEEVRSVEDAIGTKLPYSFRKIILEFSKSFRFFYRLPSKNFLPSEFRNCYRGNFYWDLGKLVDLEKGRKLWITDCYCDESDEYDKVWYNKLVFDEIANGDMLAIDIGNGNVDGQVVYLSHDGDELHGTKMANNFEDLLIRWAPIGFIGEECWQWEPFITSEGISPTCDNALKFRKLLKLN